MHDKNTDGGTFSLDGEAITDMGEFLADNAFGSETLDLIKGMNPGDEVVLGGGAAATFILRRVA